MNNPLSQIGKINKMRQIGEQKKKEMQAVKVSGVSDKNRVNITLNGLYEIVELDINDELLSVANKELLKKAINSAYSDARKKLEKELAKSMDMKQLMEMFNNQ